ncbi:MAG: GldG family protein, partial [Anaerolineae bacterium]|nr:GldG family protein [Anaerolineae bacterium]
FHPHDVRAFFASRYARYGGSTLLSILFFSATALILYWVAYQNDSWRIDVTADARHTAPPETVALLRELDEPVHVMGFYSFALGTQREQARLILDNLSAASPNLTYEFVDPEVNPLLAQQYELNFDGTLVFIRNRNAPDEVFSRANSLSESDIHTALLKVINPVAKTLYMLTGHGELDAEDVNLGGMSSAAGLLSDQGFTVEPLNLFTAGAVPEDATVVAIVGPRVALDEAEVEAISTYLEDGGSLFAVRDLIDLQGSFLGVDDALDRYLHDEWGITLREDIIIDPEMARAGQTSGLDFLGASLGPNPIITDDLRRFGVRFSVARSIATAEASEAIVTPLVQTTAGAWGETNVDLLIETLAAAPDGDDAQGVLTVGLAAENPASGARLVVFGDADFVNNANLFVGGNSLLFTNSLNWLAADETTIELPPRPAIERQINIPDGQLRLLRTISTWFGPMLMGLVGLFVWARRRNNQ